VTDLPSGWTDDMTVRLPEGVSVDEVTDFVLGLLGQVQTEEELDGKLSSAFGLSHEDADLVRDRVCGGIVRAYRSVCPVCDFETLTAPPYATWPPPTGIVFRQHR
jgi:hypothetical protein